MMISPGLFDLQVNGYAGVDFNSETLTAERLDHALEAMLVAGVTGCLPTLITAHPKALNRRITALELAINNSRLGASMVPGYHLEGPFLNDTAGYRGCHPAAAMTDPSLALIDELEEHLQRPILLVTLAPERNGGVAAVRMLVAAGKVVAIGHSAAGYDVVADAVAAGLTLSTHLGNGLPGTLPKIENTVLAQLAQKRLAACLIADGHHLSPNALQALVNLKSPKNCILVTDAVTAAAAPSGTFRFADMEVYSDARGKVSKSGETSLAGSALSLDQAVRNAVRWGIVDVRTAISMASDNPRAAIAPALAANGILIEPGELSWDDGLVPTVTVRDRIGRTDENSSNPTNPTNSTNRRESRKCL